VPFNLKIKYHVIVDLLSVDYTGTCYLSLFFNSEFYFKMSAVIDNPSVSDELAQARAALHSTEKLDFRTPIQIVIVVAILIWGLLIKPDEVLTAESGLGYALGIIGGVMMLLLLLYPVRKQMKETRFNGSVPGWFKFHMFCGVFGPIAILYHSNFGFGSLNSTVAMYSMLLVAGSGVVGRFFYSKIHYGLYGRKASLNELSHIIDSEGNELHDSYLLIPEIVDQLKAYHARSVQVLGFWASVSRFFVLGVKLRWAFLALPYRLKKVLNANAVKHGWSDDEVALHYLRIKSHIKSFLNASLRACEFSAYERLFGLWHLLHLPMFLMLVISAFVHVYAVHMF